MESPDYMVLNPMRITFLTKEFKLLGEIPHSKKHVANKKEQEEIFLGVLIVKWLSRKSLKLVFWVRSPVRTFFLCIRP